MELHEYTTFITPKTEGEVWMVLAAGASSCLVEKHEKVTRNAALKGMICEA